MKPFLSSRTFLSLAATVLTCVVFDQSRAQAQDRVPESRDEQAPVFDARDLLDARLLKGPDYVIENRVSVLDYRFVFYLKTSYGRLVAHGIPMLELRLRELGAIEAAKRLAAEPQLIEGVLQTIADTPQGLRVLLTEPDQALRRIPTGFRRMASRFTDEDDRRAGNATRRQLAANLECDPETRNPILDRLLDNIALRKSVGELASKTALGFAVPGLSLVPMTAELKQTIANYPPSEINDSVERELVALGVWPRLARRFRDEPSFTAMERLIYLRQLQGLRKITGFQVLMERAVAVESEARALSTIEELRLLNSLQRQDGIQSIDLFELPLAKLADGRNVLVCAADYLSDTPEIRDALRNYRRSYPDVDTILMVAGRVSPQLKETLGDTKISAIENPRLD